MLTGPACCSAPTPISEVALEDSGVVTFRPEEGDQFEPRMHRRVGGERTGDAGRRAGGPGPAQRIPGRGTVAPIAPAEVVLFLPAAAGEERPAAVSRARRRSRAPRHSAATGERKES